MLNETYHLPVKVKWPNDLVFEGRKLAGLLTEARIDADLMRDLVCGLGLNVNGDPAKWTHGRSATASAAAKVAGTLQLVNAGKALPINAVAADIVLAGKAAFTDFIAGRIDKEFGDLWSRFDALNGNVVSVALLDGTLKGRAAGVDATGALKISLPDGSIRTVQSGDVSLGGYG